MPAICNPRGRLTQLGSPGRMCRNRKKEWDGKKEKGVERRKKEVGRKEKSGGGEKGK